MRYGGSKYSRIVTLSFIPTLLFQKKQIKEKFGTAIGYFEVMIQPPIGKWLEETYKIEHVDVMAEREMVVKPRKYRSSSLLTVPIYSLDDLRKFIQWNNFHCAC